MALEQFMIAVQEKGNARLTGVLVLKKEANVTLRLIATLTYIATLFNSNVNQSRILERDASLLTNARKMRYAVL